MAKNIVICCDGTGNEIAQNLSNVLKLFRVAKKDPEQRVYYGAGIGTIGTSDAWSRFRQNLKSTFSLATGYGLDADILGAYTFVCANFAPGDEIFFFGFSRGAYTVRAVAGMIHLVGLLAPDQLNIANYALRSYKQASDDGDLSAAWHFSKVAGCTSAPIKFVGVWDTVASVIVPRSDRLLPQLLTLPYTRRNPSVQIFRHAIALDERRRMFRLNRWNEVQYFVRDPFARNRTDIQQDVKQVWFAGVHGDIGGGYPETESGLAKLPLDWMISEAKTHGLRLDEKLRGRIVRGRHHFGVASPFVAPDPLARLHNSMTWGWKPLEWIPKSAKWREWRRREVGGLYLPQSEPRSVPIGALLHQSVIDRMKGMDYRPENIPPTYRIEP
ncbi:MAG TPA: DUF2235 domain-containing protein [Rhizobiaceae bacterium]|nr:DUF2235 domain-containing protein [Rhizobiaceae bacterium]